jgi:hypothetical protein
MSEKYYNIEKITNSIMVNCACPRFITFSLKIMFTLIIQKPKQIKIPKNLDILISR